LSTTSPEADRRRYFMSQICCDIEPTSAMAEISSFSPAVYHSSGFVREFPPDHSVLEQKSSLQAPAKQSRAAERSIGSRLLCRDAPRNDSPKFGRNLSKR
jgi:hypothetical protein